MTPAELTNARLAYWAQDDTVAVAGPATYASPDPTTASCRAVQTVMQDGSVVVRVPWQLDEVELAHLAKGGTLWLSTFGGLPPHLLEVQAP